MNLLSFTCGLISVFLLIGLEIFKEWLKYDSYNKHKLKFSDFVDNYYYINLRNTFKKNKAQNFINKISNTKTNTVTLIQIIILIFLVLFEIINNL